ncbi:tail assembly chaperone [Pediococcus pentosaceus]|jgi:phosphate uptake regulator|uniref:tail assembly chaperone n=1 Tax=Pediococcus pentosaceus TaxID=1255 RepID=UPI0018A16FA2|nr:tail assembly chaperone [Pediococcus pentosaceus]MBF7122900.1 hypothetical protein [Pediococcus pentosaceus]MCT3032576.1 hypothetical protein [Pediococcus pentosaceus]QQT98014.1 hypothetical protein I6I91_02585 [Pediococcus pentosaceus]WKF71881.1 tail assembly chaperone [Pediococcus pentosaceus]
MEIEFAGKEYKTKFNYSALFKANLFFSDKDKDGNDMKNGAASLFMRLISGDDTALSDVIKLFVPKKVTDDQLLHIVDDITEEGDKAEDIVEEFITEMKTSGFFERAIQNFKKQIEKAIEVFEKKEQSEEVSQQLEGLKSQLTLLNKKLS